ncbi:MAG: hypothetical protein O2821_02015 [Chloroflexi bacterium]|nr:hypothetical protein [Chloroflexota bacterium]
MTSVRPADADSAQELTLSVRSQDPLLAKQILEAWTEVFVENSNLLIEAKLSQSNRLKFSQYEKAGLELAAKEEERLSYLRQNSLALLVSGREVSLSQFGDVTDQLNRALGELVDVRPRLDSIRSALAVEPRLLVLDQMIKDQTLLTILADEINKLEPEQYLDLTLTTELPNDVYISLRQEEVRLESEQAALTARIAFMEGELAEFESDIESQSIQINTTELGLKRINRELGILEENFDRISRAIQPSLLDLPELSESFLESDPVSEPRVPITSANPLTRRLIAGGVAGLVWGR